MFHDATNKRMTEACRVVHFYDEFERAYIFHVIVPYEALRYEPLRTVALPHEENRKIFFLKNGQTLQRQRRHTFRISAKPAKKNNTAKQN